MFFDVDRREDVVLHKALRDDDGVLEVVSLPRHERHEQVLAQGQFTMVGGGPVGQQLVGTHLVAGLYPGPLVDAGVLVGTLELEQLVAELAFLAVVDGDRVAVDGQDRAGLSGQHHVGGVECGPDLDARADVRRLGTHQRHGLTLHVGAHQGAVGVVVLEERDQRRGDRDDLLRRDVHELDLFRRHVRDLGGGAEEDGLLELQVQVLERGRLRRPTHEDALVLEGAIVVQRRVGLGDDVLLLLVGGEVDDLVGDLALRHDAVGRLDEPEQVHLSVGGQRTDEADVRTLGRLDRTHAPVVREVDVADLEAGALPGEPARAER